jgi:D-alanine-D-alanine ligase
MMKALPEEQYDVSDIYVDKRGVWHHRGMPSNPARALAQVDVVLNAIHGGVGEDGTVQRMVQRMGVPYVGSQPLASGVAYNKIRAREVLSRAGLRLPQAVSFSLGTELTTADMARTVFEQFGAPYVVKPANEGSSHGVRIVHTLIDLPDAVGDVLDEYGSAIIEEYIRGKEAVVGVVEDFRGESLYALPPASVQLPDGARMLTRAHHDEGVRYAVPSDFSHDTKQQLSDAARAAHLALGLAHLSLAGFIVTPRGPYLLEVDTVPHIHESSAFPRMLESVGSSVGDMLEHLIDLARR